MGSILSTDLVLELNEYILYVYNCFILLNGIPIIKNIVQTKQKLHINFSVQQANLANGCSTACGLSWSMEKGSIHRYRKRSALAVP